MPGINTQPDSTNARETGELLKSQGAKVPQSEEMTAKDRVFEELLRRASGV